MIAGTQIRIADGSTKNVENVQVGDFLVGYDLQPPFPAFVKVKTTQLDQRNEFCVINERLRITQEYAIMVKDKVIGNHTKTGLFGIERLNTGDLMVRWDGTTEEITSIYIVYGETTNYNFTTDANHLYIADDVVVCNPAADKF